MLCSKGIQFLKSRFGNITDSYIHSIAVANLLIKAIRHSNLIVIKTSR